ncbi:MAG: NAD-dependent epimerase/dehydratase family protein [Saprospiraceae bacterium]|nr:NAD-dependent epimerase/dehydratase family protein [Saprospiraceae bacterium]
MKKVNYKILVTGATGLVGSYVVRTLLLNGYANVAVTTRKNSNLTLLGDAADRIKIFHADLTDVIGLEDAILGRTHIIHCGALVSFDSRDKRPLIKTNVEGTANLINLSLEHGIKRFIHLSSIAALGRNNKEGGLTDEYTKYEDNPYNSYYSITKHLAELEVWRGKAEGLDVRILLPGLILGSGYWKTGTNGFFNHVWRKSPFYPGGSNGFVDVRDVAAFAVRMLSFDGDEEKFLMIGHNVTYKAFLDTIAKYLKVKPPSIKAKKWILGTAWRLDKLRTLFTGGRPMLTKETAATSVKNYRFANDRSLTVPGFDYTPFEQTIREIADQYLEASNSQFQPTVLNVHKL